MAQSQLFILIAIQSIYELIIEQLVQPLQGNINQQRYSLHGVSVSTSIPLILLHGAVTLSYNRVNIMYTSRV